MGRPPCCDKIGVKKGPWTPEEDIILVSYIQEHGPGNWRAVPTNTGKIIFQDLFFCFWDWKSGEREKGELGWFLRWLCLIKAMHLICIYIYTLSSAIFIIILFLIE